jgi:hypothetical protein
LLLLYWWWNCNLLAFSKNERSKLWLLDVVLLFSLFIYVVLVVRFCSLICSNVAAVLYIGDEVVITSTSI